MIYTIINVFALFFFIMSLLLLLKSFIDILKSMYYFGFTIKKWIYGGIELFILSLFVILFIYLIFLNNPLL
jgi:hypothetical protein